MDEIAIHVENLGKRYLIGQREQYKTLRDAIVRAAYSPFRFLKRGLKTSSNKEYFWALKDVSFDISQGDVLGIIGRNGAGKSTLLKILSRITMPTSGLVELYGRVGSLLEVGTGFHSELTGRENIYLSGCILGMKRREIEEKFEEIVKFSEIEKFLDTPVKRYSSGMYVRLAFAVAAHLDPEILLVDEVLAVGDTEFQKKCLGKMGSVANEGRTVVFVSHAMASVQSLCTKGLVLKEGRIDFKGDIEDAISHYTSSAYSTDPVKNLIDVKPRKGTGEILIASFWAEDESGKPSLTIPNGKPCTLVFRGHVRDSGMSYNGIGATIGIKNYLGIGVFYHHNFLSGQNFNQVHGDVEFRLNIPKLPLCSGMYTADLVLSRVPGHTIIDSLIGCVSFDVHDGDYFGTGSEYRGGMQAIVMVDGSWDLRRY
jgi:lipopolysaccharide transport system ATP-binding protein